MLTGDFEQLRLTNYYDMIRKFARGHVSRFPMKFEFMGTNSSLHFYDSRFTKPVAKLYRNEGKFVLQSDLIHNNKYSEHNSLYRTRASSNVKAIGDWLDTYVRPIAPDAIWKLYITEAESLHHRWTQEFASTIDGINLHGYGSRQGELRDTFVRDLMQHILHGATPYSHPDLARFKTKEFAEMWFEHSRRDSISKPTTHIFINPDETMIRWDGTAAYTYNTISEMGEELRSKLSLVKMLESNQMIGEVGMKISPVSFWLY